MTIEEKENRKKQIFGILGIIAVLIVAYYYVGEIRNPEHN
jgi:hypothetical protein